MNIVLILSGISEDLVCVAEHPVSQHVEAVLLVESLMVTCV